MTSGLGLNEECLSSVGPAKGCLIGRQWRPEGCKQRWDGPA
jgi:hypothetical protein